MSAGAITAAVATLVGADPAACDRVGLAELVAVAQRVRCWLDALDTTIAACADRLAVVGACEPAAEVLASEGRRAGRDARAAADRGAVCTAMPALHDALAAGAVAAGHVDAVARVARDLDTEHRDALAARALDLVAAATVTSVEAFERHVRDLGRQLSADDGVCQHERLRQQRSLRRWTDRQTGLAHTHLALDPETDARLNAALDAAIAAERHTDEARTFDQLRADAFVALATGARTTGRRPPELSVLIDLASLEQGLHDRAVCETADGAPLPPATVRRLACEATLIAHVLDGHGAVLDAGRSRRVATADQRRALRAMYRTCGHPGCTVRFADCEIHHVIEWIRQRGPTDLANLLPLCDRHHHLVHEGGWRLTLHPDRTITLHRPDGTLSFHGRTIDVAPTGVRAPVADPDASDTANWRPEEPDVDDQTDDEITICAALARARLQALGPPAWAA